jgi:hypothetical protein
MHRDTSASWLPLGSSRLASRAARWLAPHRRTSLLSADYYCSHSGGAHLERGLADLERRHLSLNGERHNQLEQTGPCNRSIVTRARVPRHTAVAAQSVLQTPPPRAAPSLVPRHIGTSSLW